MSISEAPVNGSDNGDGTRTYRGRTLEELVPQIRAELGTGAIIVREREGLTGGVGGFFQQRCVEIDAQPGPSIDVYDDEEDAVMALEHPFAAALDAAEAVQDQRDGDAEDGDKGMQSDLLPVPVTAAEPVPVPAPAPVAAAEPVTAPEPVAAAEPVAPAAAVVAAPAPKSRVRRRRAAKAAAAGWAVDPAEAMAIVRELTGRGISDAWAAQLVSDAAAHATPFAGGDGLRGAVRTTLASFLSNPAPLANGGCAVAFVGAGGAGKTRAAAAFATAYRRASTLAVSAVSIATADGGRALEELLNPAAVEHAATAKGKSAERKVASGRDGAVVVVDTSSANPSNPESLRAELEPLALDAVLVALPATLGAQPGRQLLAGLAPLRPTGIVVTHIDETDQLGVAVELSVRTQLPISFLHEGLDVATAMTAATPDRIARRLLP
jgi:flagellar biosynthesis GTPase FlhF